MFNNVCFFSFVICALMQQALCSQGEFDKGVSPRFRAGYVPPIEPRVGNLLVEAAPIYGEVKQDPRLVYDPVRKMFYVPRDTASLEVAEKDVRF